MMKAFWTCLLKKTRLRVKCDLFVLTCYKQTRDGHLCYAIGACMNKGELFALMQEDLKCYGEDMVLDLAVEAEPDIMDFHYHTTEPGHEVFLEYRIARAPLYRIGGAPGAYAQAKSLVRKDQERFTFRHCDWCGSVAQKRIWRTLYAGTDGEHTSRYWECGCCICKSTEELLKQFSEPFPF